MLSFMDVGRKGRSAPGFVVRPTDLRTGERVTELAAEELVEWEKRIAETKSLKGSE
jgi:hypothetical protein